MNNLVKTAVASALALGATSAFAIGVPSSNSSDLVLYVDALTASGASAGVYALDTNISLSSLMPGPYNGNSTAYSKAFSAGGTQTFTASATLQSFLSANSGNTIEWTLEGGQYNNAAGFANGSVTGPNNNNSVAPGSALAVFTSAAIQLSTGVAKQSTVQLQDFLGGLQNDISSGGISGLLTAKETTGTENVGAENKYGFIGANDLAPTGTTANNLYGFTGNGVNNGQLQDYILGTATLSSNGTLTVTGNPSSAPVPLPAAVWLLGSGVMGLVGVSRRRKAQAAV